LSNEKKAKEKLGEYVLWAGVEGTVMLTEGVRGWHNHNFGSTTGLPDQQWGAWAPINRKRA